MKQKLKDFRSADGTRWRVGVQAPGSSNAMVVFYHPAGGTARRDRYSWHNTIGPEARNVSARVEPQKVLDALTERDLALLYRRSMAISTPVPLPEAG